jgi:ABC-type amino acid transport system permease subunit
MTTPTAEAKTRSAALAEGSRWRNQRFRALLYQVLAVIILLMVGGYVLSNTFANLEARSIRTGFGFLDREAGFRIGESPHCLRSHLFFTPQIRGGIIVITNEENENHALFI